LINHLNSLTTLLHGITFNGLKLVLIDKKILKTPFLTDFNGLET